MVGIDRTGQDRTDRRTERDRGGRSLERPVCGSKHKVGRPPSTAAASEGPFTRSDEEFVRLFVNLRVGTTPSRMSMNGKDS
ncbi:hypothetical protein [Streptomyces tendae]|uniref:hypothetical protein n=1 Tax=Streptomyces tendae TaxID=1932 RepID=UPI001150EAEA